MDNDGDLDLIINNINSIASILENKTNKENKSLTIELKNTKPVKGSRVTIFKSNNKVDVKDNQWNIFEPKILENNSSKSLDNLRLYSNFNYARIQNLYSNLSSLSLIELFKLKENYQKLNYSTIEVDIQLQKLISLPIYLTLMTILSALIMFNTKHFKSSTLKLVHTADVIAIIYLLRVC